MTTNNSADQVNVISGTTPGCNLLGSVTASNSATVIFSGLSNTVYSRYEIVITAALPVTNGANLYLTTSNNSGSTYGGNIYATNYLQWNPGGSGTGGTNNLAQIQINQGSSIDNTNSVGLNGTIQWRDLVSSSQQFFNWNAVWLQASGTTIYSINGWAYASDNSAAITNVKLAMSTGNISFGTFKLYGYLA